MQETEGDGERVPPRRIVPYCRRTESQSPSSVRMSSRRNGGARCGAESDQVGRMGSGPALAARLFFCAADLIGKHYRLVGSGWTLHAESRSFGTELICLLLHINRVNALLF